MDSKPFITRKRAIWYIYAHITYTYMIDRLYQHPHMAFIRKKNCIWSNMNCIYIDKQRCIGHVYTDIIIIYIGNIIV